MAIARPNVQLDILSDAEAAWVADVNALGDRAAAHPDAARSALLAYLHEGHAIYRDRGSAAVVRMRGWVLLACAQVPWSTELERFILEELDNGQDPYLTAVAASVLRRMARPSTSYTLILQRALDTVRWHDDAMQLDTYGGYVADGASTTAVREVLAALEWLGPRAAGALITVQSLAGQAAQMPTRTRVQLTRTLTALTRQEESLPTAASCCEAPATAQAADRSELARSLAECLLQDQDGVVLRFGDFFSGKPALLTFFYTRCGNPRKCSATMERLAQLQRALRAAGVGDKVRTAAVTYDPAYDRPSLLAAYATARGWQFDADHRVLRTVGEFEPLQQALQLGVNFVSSVVNRHRLDVLLVDRYGTVVESCPQLTWQVPEMCQRLVELAGLDCHSSQFAASSQGSHSVE